MNEILNLHTFGHSVGLWLFQNTNAWFEFVLHTVLMVTPAAMALLIATWLFHLIRRIAEGYRSAKPKTLSTGIFGYVFRHTRRTQILLLAAALVALPLLYAGLELPKSIINNAISSSHFPVEIIGVSLSQTKFLFLLSSLYLTVILINGSLKYVINVQKGRVAESLLRRLRLTIYRYWRRDTGHRNRSEVIPMLVQEVEPIGGFAGDAFVLPLFQGGTFLTILAFMFVQDPVLGAAAITLLPVQLALIPRLQRKINQLSRRRAHEMRGLGSAIGREITVDMVAPGESRRQVAVVLRRIAEIRFQIYRKKFLMKGLNNFLTQLTPFFFYTVGGYLVIEDRLSFGALVAVLAAHKDFSAPLNELLKYYQSMEDVRVRFEETRRFLSARTATTRIPSATADTLLSSCVPCNPDSPRSAGPRPLATARRYLEVFPGRRKLQPCCSRNYTP